MKGILSYALVGVQADLSIRFCPNPHSQDFVQVRYTHQIKVNQCPVEHSTDSDKILTVVGAQWLSGRVLDSRPKGRRFEPHCVVSLSKNINPNLVLVQPRKTRPFINERLILGRSESKQTNKQTLNENACV